MSFWIFKISLYEQHGPLTSCFCSPESWVPPLGLGEKKFIKKHECLSLPWSPWSISADFEISKGLDVESVDPWRITFVESSIDLSRHWSGWKQRTMKSLEIQEYLSGEQKMRTRSTGIHRWLWRQEVRPIKLGGSDCMSFPASQNDLETESRSSCRHAQSCLTLCNPWTVPYQPPLCNRFPRQEYWRGLSFPSKGISLTRGSNPRLLHWQAGSL